MDDSIKRTLQESYDANARLRERSELQPWKIDERNKFLTSLRQTEPLRLLDIGAGAGQHGRWFRDHGLHVTCVDLSPAMVRACREKGLEAYVMDFYSLAFAEGTFDAAWAMNSLLHVPKRNLSTVLNSIKQVLKPGGLFYLGVYGGVDSEGVWEEDPYKPQRFFSFYEHEEIKQKVAEVFELVQFEVVPLEGPFDFQSIILRK